MKKEIGEQDKLMQMAVDMSRYALESKRGGPFGAIVVRNGKIIGSSGNAVLAEMDPTAHAEVMAIRDACKNIQSTDLSDCEMYSSAEPCPLCTAAIYWSKIAKVFYSNTEDESMEHGFIDKVILAELRKPKEKRELVFKKLKNDDAIKIFREALENF